MTEAQEYQDIFVRLPPFLCERHRGEDISCAVCYGMHIECDSICDEVNTKHCEVCNADEES